MSSVRKKKRGHRIETTFEGCEMWRVLKKCKEIAREMRGNLVKGDVLEIKGSKVYFVKYFFWNILILHRNMMLLLKILYMWYKEWWYALPNHKVKSRYHFSGPYRTLSGQVFIRNLYKRYCKAKRCPLFSFLFEDGDNSGIIEGLQNLFSSYFLRKVHA